MYKVLNRVVDADKTKQENVFLTMRARGFWEINFCGDNMNVLKTRDINVRCYRDNLKRMGLQQLATSFTHVALASPQVCWIALSVS